MQINNKNVQTKFFLIKPPHFPISQKALCPKTTEQNTFFVKGKSGLLYSYLQFRFHNIRHFKIIF